MSTDNGTHQHTFQVTPEDCATQVTLLDLEAFTAILPEEFLSCCWNKYNKLQITPNIVAFTRRFNQLSFWVVQEVLKYNTPKQRADIIVFYIRIGQKLIELNNYHSLFAIVSALRSASVYRLHKTWNFVPKRDRQIFNKLSNVFSEDDNWKNLRNNVENFKLPCIPYLGMFLTDLIYIDVAHPRRNGMENEQRTFKMNNVLRIISNLQQSKYNITPLPHVQSYLNSIQYIEELQKFIEDDQYKLSLKLEPLHPPSNSTCVDINSICKNGSCKEINVYDRLSIKDATLVAALNLSPLRIFSKVHNGFIYTDDVNEHRRIVRGLGTASAASDSCTLCIPPSFKHQDLSRHLIDDSILEESNNNQNENLEQSSFNLNRELSHPVLLEGSLKRKTVMKGGCHSAVSSWRRYWVQMTYSILLFYSPKCFKSNNRNERCGFKREPCKIWSVDQYIVSLANNQNIFFLKNTYNSKTYKFKAINDLAALNWYRTLYNASESEYKESSPTNLIAFE